MNHEESRLQQQFITWFRSQYPQFAMLMTHPINEGSKNTRVSGSIHKAEGTVAGVADLLFFLPSYIRTKDIYGNPVWTEVHGLCIEWKTPSGKQSPEQKRFQKMVEAAGFKYDIVRDQTQARLLIMDYIATAAECYKDDIMTTYKAIEKEMEDKEREKFYKVIGKTKHQ